MRVPFSWLKEFVSIRLTAASLAERLLMAGLEVERIDTTLDDPVLEINVTPNRGDCLSVRGIAREVAALLGGTGGARGAVKPPGRPGGIRCLRRCRTAGKAADFVSVELKEKIGCPRYAMRIVDGVRVGPSPDWLVSRLARCGVRSVNNVVDVTNWVLMGLGQPLHAFDLGKIKERRILIRRAASGERFTTLDGRSHDLDERDLLIADPLRGIALAGIMGGKDSEVDGATRTVALESAFFNPVWIRGSAKRRGIMTESSYRFERRVDPEGVVEALNHASLWIARLAGGTPTTDWIDRYPGKTKPREISLDPREVGEFLGGTWPPAEVKKKLNSLGLSERRRNLWRVPSHRGDLREGVDLVEEAARLGGYHRIPETFPSTTPGRRLLPPNLDRPVRRWMADQGFFETIHLGFFSPADLEGTGLKGVPLANPLGWEYSLLRPSLLPSLLKSAAFHHQHKLFDLRLFEFRKIFRNGDGVGERLSLAAVASGRGLAAGAAGATGAASLADAKREVDFFDLKGVLEGFSEKFGVVCDYEPGENPLLMPGRCARILSCGEEIGWLGEVHPRFADRLELKKKTFCFEVLWDMMAKGMSERPRFRSFSRLPRVERDMAVVVDEAVPAGKIKTFLAGQENGLVREVRFFDLYRGNQIPPGKKSLAFALLLGLGDRTLTEEEVNEAWRRILDSVRREFHADIR